MSTKPRVSISTAFNYEIPLSKQLVMIAKAGFTHVSLGMNVAHRKKLSAGGLGELRRIIEGHGLAVDTYHGRSLEESNSFRRARSAAEAASALGARAVVLHPGPRELEAADLEGHLEDLLVTCDTLANIARNEGLVFAIENRTPGPATELCTRALDMIDSDCFGLCYDSSHEQNGGPHPFDLLKRFRGRIAAAHLSDRSNPSTGHTVPGEGYIDWDRLALALRRARYRGPLLMEVLMHDSRYRHPATFLKKACEAGRRIWKQIHG